MHISLIHRYGIVLWSSMTLNKNKITEEMHYYELIYMKLITVTLEHPIFVDLDQH